MSAAPGRLGRRHRRPAEPPVLHGCLPSLFAGKMHALLCRGWKTRVKGRDGYDLVWYVSRGTKLDLAHLEARMRQGGHREAADPLDAGTFRSLLAERIDRLDVARARALHSGLLATISSQALRRDRNGPGS